jgi:hypothetical protein
VQPVIETASNEERQATERSVGETQVHKVLKEIDLFIHIQHALDREVP